MNKKVTIGVALVAGLAISIFLLLQTTKPWIEQRVADAVRQRCKSCEIRLGRIGLSWRGITLDNVQFSGGPSGGQRVEVHAPRIVLRPRLSTIFNGHPALRSVSLFGPTVTFWDGDKVKRSALKTSQVEPLVWPEDLQFSTIISDGVFNYVRDVKNTHAELVIHQITAELIPSREHLMARATAQFGKSGHVELITSIPLLHQTLVVETEMKVKDQNLQDLSAFFQPNAGVKLDGVLTSGHAITKLKGSHLSASLWAEYKAFNLSVNKMYDRNDVQTFFTNLGAAIAMREKNINASNETKASAVELERESNESIVSFILRGLKEAALKVTLKQ
jgi:hypothetical protein